MAISWCTPTCKGGDVASDGEYKRLGKIGIEITKTSETETEVVLTINTYVATKYNCYDSNNAYYYNADASSATSKQRSVDINHTNGSGKGWTGNQTLLGTHTFKRGKTKSEQEISFSVKLTDFGWVGVTLTHTVKYTIPALKKYTISYSANDKTLTNTLPAQQYKYYGEAVYVSNTVPTTVGYYCNAWMLSASAGGTVYQFGDKYTANESAILYASWKEYVYTISYNANGDGVINVPASQTKKYGEGVTLAGAPVRENYNFLGWSTSSSDTAATYESGKSYDDWATVCTSQNETITLYAVWELAHIPPIISNVVVERCDAEGTHADDGTYFDVSFDWATDESREAMGHAVYIKAYDKDRALVVEQTFNLSDFYTFIGHFSLSDFNLKALGGGYIDNEYSYTVTITVMDSSDITSTVQRTLMSVAYPIDIYKEGKGVAFGKPASREGAFDINFDAVFNKSIEFGETALQSLKPILLDMFYPVHSIYISHSHEDPNELFGGTWERIVDRFLWGVDEEAKIGTTGGERTHTLTAAEMPEHQHTLLNYNENGYTTDEWTKSSATIGASKKGFIENLNTSKAGGGQSHNNMPPYVQVSIWHRTA